jgi:hypothetical protein
MRLVAGPFIRRFTNGVTTRVGQSVAFIPFKDAKPSGPMREVLTGWMLGPDKREVWGRPVGLLQLPDGSLLISEDGGKKMHVTRWDVVGIDLAPSPIWLDDDLELFASVSDWSSFVREGWAAVAPRLLADQTSAQDARLERDTAATAHPPPPAGLALTNARIFDVEKKKATMGTVVVKGDRIVAVGPATSIRVPAGAQTIDLGGKTVIPGLWDMHAHVFPLDGVLQVAAGVTTVRDLANDMDLVMRLRASWSAGKTVGPRVILAGFIDGRGPFQGGRSRGRAIALFAGDPRRIIWARPSMTGTVARASLSSQV